MPVESISGNASPHLRTGLARQVLKDVANAVHANAADHDANLVIGRVVLVARPARVHRDDDPLHIRHRVGPLLLYALKGP